MTELGRSVDELEVDLLEGDTLRVDKEGLKRSAAQNLVNLILIVFSFTNFWREKKPPYSLLISQRVEQCPISM